MRGRVLIGMPVEIDGVEEGRVRDVIVDPGLGRVLGLKVQRGSGQQSFVPWVAVSFAAERAGVHSAHALLSTTELAYYVAHGVLLTALREPLWDVLVARRGEVEEVVRLHPAARGRRTLAGGPEGAGADP